MFRFDFECFVTDELIAAVSDAAQCPLAQAATLRPVIAEIFEHVGGLPICESIPTEAERTKIGARWLREAIGHRLAERAYRPRSRKLRLTKMVEGVVAAYAAARDPICVNEAGADAIHKATGLSLVLANAVVAERRRGGRYLNLKDLERRVDGIGSKRASEIEHDLQFGPSDPPAWRASDIAADLRLLLQRQNYGASFEQLANALEELATSVATNPHPATRDNRMRQASAPVSLVAQQADWIGELFNDSYWPAIPTLFASAASTINVCMFHAVAGGPQHPTRKILEALIAAHQRGVAVRVLLDRDNPNDPYRSTLINASARHLLTESGVPVRQDVSSRLLHSKFIILDGHVVVIGSHNWSAGSYFNYDDLSLVIESKACAMELGSRFDRLWSDAKP